MASIPFSKTYVLLALVNGTLPVASPRPLEGVISEGLREALRVEGVSVLPQVRRPVQIPHTYEEVRPLQHAGHFHKYPKP